MIGLRNRLIIIIMIVGPLMGMFRAHIEWPLFKALCCVLGMMLLVILLIAFAERNN